MSRSEFLRIQGLRYHIRRWGEASKPKLFILHGWSDASATFEWLAQPLLQDWQVLAPDWRGFGHSGWTGQSYWFPDYLADLDAIVDHYSPEAPLRLVGHSMGAQVASLYAGLRPQRIERLVLLDGLMMPDMPLNGAAKRYGAWLDALKTPPAPKTYDSLDSFADVVRRLYPQLGPDKARWVAERWSRQAPDGRAVLLADPMHRMNTPIPYRLAHSHAIWQQITAPTLFLDGANSPLLQGVAGREETLACFAVHQHRVIEGAGHMLHLDAPGETAQQINDFLGSS